MALGGHNDDTIGHSDDTRACNGTIGYCLMTHINGIMGYRYGKIQPNPFMAQCAIVIA